VWDFTRTHIDCQARLLCFTYFGLSRQIPS
jgi:hypothetical protein